MIITYLFLLFALFAHLFVDLHKQQVGKPIYHWISATIAVSVSILVGFVNTALHPEIYFWQFAFYSLCVHFAFFDPTWNVIHKKRWNYHGDRNNPLRSISDKLWDTYGTPLLEVFVRLWVLMVGYSVYHHLDWIVGIYN